MAKFAMPSMEGFKNLSPRMRSGVVIGALGFVVMAVSLVLTPKSQILRPSVSTNDTNLLPPVTKDLSNEQLASQQAALRQRLKDQNDQLEQLKKDNSQLQEKMSKPGATEAVLEQRVATLSNQVDALINKQSQKDDPSLKQPLPPPVPAGSPPLDQPLPADDEPEIRIVRGDTPVKAVQVKENKEPSTYLPATAFFEAVTLNGMDAPTNAVASKNPVPVVVRVKSMAQLPNMFQHDIKECFVLMAGYGQLSSERALIRLESIACTKEDGRVVEAKMDGYVVGEDGRVGMRGRLVSKQGQLIAQSLAAGVLSGFGQALTPVGTPGLNLNSGTSYQMPSAGSVASTAVGTGFSTAAQAASKFYLDMAKEETPVIEIDAGRKVTLVLTKGIELR